MSISLLCIVYLYHSLSLSLSLSLALSLSHYLHVHLLIHISIHSSISTCPSIQDSGCWGSHLNRSSRPVPSPSLTPQDRESLQASSQYYGMKLKSNLGSLTKKVGRKEWVEARERQEIVREGERTENVRADSKNAF